jgi:hypothetical protein
MGDIAKDIMRGGIIGDIVKGATGYKTEAERAAAEKRAHAAQVAAEDRANAQRVAGENAASYATLRQNLFGTGQPPAPPPQAPPPQPGLQRAPAILKGYQPLQQNPNVEDEEKKKV